MNDLATMQQISKQAFGKLPDYLENKNPEVKDLQDGQYGWISSSTLMIDQQGHGWLDYDGEVFPHPCYGRNNIRVGKKDGIYVVDVSEVRTPIKREKHHLYAESFCIRVGLFTSLKGLS